MWEITEAVASCIYFFGGCQKHPKTSKVHDGKKAYFIYHGQTQEKNTHLTFLCCEKKLLLASTNKFTLLFHPKI